MENFWPCSSCVSTKQNPEGETCCLPATSGATVPIQYRTVPCGTGSHAHIHFLRPPTATDTILLNPDLEFGFLSSCHGPFSQNQHKDNQSSLRCDRFHSLNGDTTVPANLDKQFGCSFYTTPCRSHETRRFQRVGRNPPPPKTYRTASFSRKKKHPFRCLLLLSDLTGFSREGFHCRVGKKSIVICWFRVCPALPILARYPARKAFRIAPALKVSHAISSPTVTDKIKS